MTFTKILAISALAAILFGNESSALRADPSVRTMKPTHGISFDVGAKRAVSYFLNAGGQCKVVLTLAPTADLSDLTTLTATRFEARVAACESARFNDHTGPSIEFQCQQDAQSVTVRTIEHVAVGAPR